MLQPANLKFLVSVLSNNEFRIEAEGENLDLYDFAKYNAIEKGADKINLTGVYSFGKPLREIITTSKYFSTKITLTKISGTRSSFSFLITLMGLPKISAPILKLNQ
jgi:hypothetical protein